MFGEVKMIYVLKLISMLIYPYRERVQNSTGSRLEEANIAGLSPGKTYRFWTMAYNMNGAGPSSEALLVQTKAEVKVPGPPKDLKAFATSPTSILVKWKPPDPTPAGPVQSYTMFYMEVKNLFR